MHFNETCDIFAVLRSVDRKCWCSALSAISAMRLQLVPMIASLIQMQLVCDMTAEKQQRTCDIHITAARDKHFDQAFRVADDDVKCFKELMSYPLVGFIYA